jgi:CrcB protein
VALMDWRPLALVAAGAAIGGVLRYVVGYWTVARFGLQASWLATGFINVSGSLLIGVAAELATRGSMSQLARVFFATGILGGYTTFSTYALEIALLTPGSAAMAALYAGGSVGFGVAAALAGAQIARLAVR